MKRKKSNRRNLIIDRINYRIKSLKSKGYDIYSQLGEKLVNARIKFGATLTDTGRISKNSISTVNQLKVIEKMIPLSSRVKLKLDVTYQQQTKEYKQNFTRSQFESQVLEISDFFEKLEFFYSDNLVDTVESFKEELKGHRSYSDIYNLIQKYKEME